MGVTMFPETMGSITRSSMQPLHQRGIMAAIYSSTRCTPNQHNLLLQHSIITAQDSNTVVTLSQPSRLPSHMGASVNNLNITPNQLLIHREGRQ
jgi:hypothetical protein